MKRTAIAILIAVLVVVLGAGLCIAGLSAVGFSLEKLDRTEFVTNVYTFDTVRALDVEAQTADVELVASEDGAYRVTCLETDREKYTVTVQDGTLTVRPAQSKLRFRLFSFRSPRITVALPAGTYEELRAHMGTGDMRADKALAFGTVSVELSTGDLAMSGVQADRVTVHSSTGDIRLSDMTPETLTVTLSTGEIELNNVVCTGDLRCQSSTGDIHLTDVDGANLYLKATTGDITGTIRTEKIFAAHASTGRVSVPASAPGAGLCDVHTSTGDIRLSVSGN